MATGAGAHVEGQVATLFLDAGGVLVYPNWWRISDTLARHGTRVSPDALRLAEPHAKFLIDEGSQIAATSDAQRGWQYMNLVLEKAGVTRSSATDAALQELRDYHAEHNLWEYIPDDVVPTLERLRASVKTLVVVSNANGVLHRLFDRVDLTRHFDVICDSCLEGVEKPDPRFFQIALERSDSRAETTMHVGDLYHVDVVGARRAGLQAMLLDVAGLYEGVDCARVRTMSELADAMEQTINHEDLEGHEGISK
jgi:HAD superfamily hydrolase (TIGR01509 family)